METIYNQISLTGIAASLTNAIGVEAPKLSEESIGLIDNLVSQCTKNGKVDRIFMYNPDAIGMWLYQKYTSFYEPMVPNVKLTLPLKCMMPSVTPVCFGTMYTGVTPEVHGIKSYTKPVITVDSIFDAFIRAGKKPAIVSTVGDSLSKIFLEREMDYYICDSVDECTEKALQLIEEDKYDFILLYNADFDSTMHKNGPESKIALEVLQKNISVYNRIADAIKKNWSNHETLLGFAPDHGCHEIDGDLGSHGLDMPEDLNILHFYTVL